MNSALVLIGVPICAAFGASAISFAKERSAWSLLQLLGAAFLFVVVFTHLAEAFHLFPWMGWGLPDSVGHDADLISAVAGLILFPTDREASMKKVAAAFGGKSAQMMRPAEAERLTGDHVGGISPFGQKRRVPTALDASATGQQRVFVNGGQRGLQIELRPEDIVAVLKPIVAGLTGQSRAIPRRRSPAPP